MTTAYPSADTLNSIQAWWRTVKTRCETFFDLSKNFPLGKSYALSDAVLVELQAIYLSVRDQPYPNQALPVRQHLLDAMQSTLQTIQALPHDIIAANNYTIQVHNHMQSLDAILNENLYTTYAF